MITISRFFLLFSVLVISSGLHAKNNNHIICIENADLPAGEKEAVLILPGLGDGRKQRKHQEAFFCGKGYDVFIPDYIDKDGFQTTYDNFVAFHRDYKLGAYQKLHVFSYILGSWTINTFIQKNGSGNITSIVYDRSPMQELAPELIVENIPLIAKMLFGKLPEDLTHLPYPTIDTTGIHVGIVVESKATAVLRFYEKKAKLKRDFNWGEIDFHQAHDDLMYTYLNHDEMYLELDVFGHEALTFFKQGSFSVEVRRQWYGWDSFEKLPSIKKKVHKNSNLRGTWETHGYYSPLEKDTLKNYLGLDKNGFILLSSSRDTAVQPWCGTGMTPVLMNRKKTLLKHRPNDDIHTLDQLPEKDDKGRWFLILDGIKYWKLEE